MNVRDTRGQAAVMTVLFLTVLIGASAMSLDVGSWYHAKRQLQAEADAAALAGAQALPDSPADAKAYAIEYSNKNGGNLTPSQITIASDITTNDTIKVHLSAPAPGFFSKLFGLSSVTVGAGAAARSDNVGAALRVAPIVVNWLHPKLQCHPLPCPGPTEIDLADLHNPGSGDAAGAFGLIDLIQSDNGSVGASDLADWITQGFDEYMDPGLYYSAPSSKFNSVQVRDAMTVSIGQVLLFPIYRSIVGPGSNAQYDIIGWVGFIIRSYNTQGSAGTLTGVFTRYIAEGIPVENGGGPPDTGVHEIELVN
jgi:hypothetical protein